MSTSKLLFLFFVVSLAGCANLGRHVMTHPGIYLSQAQFIATEPEKMGFQQQRYCSAKSKVCVDYLSAFGYRKADFSPEQFVYYQLEAQSNGVTNEIEYKASVGQFEQFKGTVVLFHGYGGNKKVMLASAIYFRSLGFDVLLPDLFGHGDSDQDFAFGAVEHSVINELLVDTAPVNPVIAVGHSMGGLTAANSLLSPAVDGAILLAPMMQIDLSSAAFLPYKSEFLADMFSDDLAQMVSTALRDAELELANTNPLNALAAANKPALVINSVIDPISPPEYFRVISADKVSQKVLADRTHPSLLLFDQSQSDFVKTWLLTNIQGVERREVLN